MSLEDSLPHPTAGIKVERTTGIEPVMASLATTPRTLLESAIWLLRQDLHLLPPAYQADAHLHVLRSRIGQDGWIRTIGFLVPGEAVWPLTYVLKLDTRSGIAPPWTGLQPAAFASRPSREMV